MTDVTGRSALRRSRPARENVRRPHPLPTLVGLTATFDIQPDVIGDRGGRLSLAVRAGLPIPAGTIVTSTSLGCIDGHLDAATPPSTDAVHDVFEQLGRGGRMALMVSVSPVSTSVSSADRIVGSRSVTSCSELVHAVRRLSATASVLGDTIAVIIQVDVDAVVSGTFVSSANRERVVGSVESTDGDIDPARLMDLAERISAVFDGARRISWCLDRFDRLWILDIGPPDSTGGRS